MNILITTVQVPFVRGGGEILAEGLCHALQSIGHKVEILDAPFRFNPMRAVEQSLDWWAAQDLSHFCAGKVDRVIHLKFPCFHAKHPQPVLWLLHQHRAFYELWDSLSSQDTAACTIRDNTIKRDTDALESIPSRFTISKRVSQRLLEFNKIESAPLYHPPYAAERFYCNDSLPYIFSPSRLESLKRQLLLIEAMAHVKAPIAALIAGEGGQRELLERRIGELGLESKVRLIGRISDEEMRTTYANARAVFFGPFDEDYGYITLEAMLSSKPVITCKDSGGPLEFVRDGETGLVVSPDPQAVAQAIERYARNPLDARAHGLCARKTYEDVDISWKNVVDQLLS